MRIKWESNSRVKHLAAEGKINVEDIIPKTTTNSFPEDCATVRLERPREQLPLIVIHFKGSEKKSKHGWAYQTVPTARVSFGGTNSYWSAWNAATVSGEVDFDSWPLNEMNEVVDFVKGAFE